MARVIKAKFACSSNSLVALGDRVYGISFDKKKLLCLDPVTGEQTSINLGAAAPHEQPYQSQLVGCEGSLFLCSQFDDPSWSIVKYEPATNTFKKVKAPRSKEGSDFRTAVEWNGKFHLVCSDGVWVLNPATEAMHFVKANFGCYLHACAYYGKIYIFSHQRAKGNPVWELDPVTRNLERCCDGPSHGVWQGTANLQGRVCAIFCDGNDTCIFQLQRPGGNAGLKEMVSIKGLCHGAVAVGEHLVVSAYGKFMVYNPTTGALECCPLNLGQDSSNIEWCDLCAASGKLVGLSFDGTSLLIVQFTITLGPAEPNTDDQTQQTVSKQGQHAAPMMQELLAHLHRVKATDATTYDAAKAKAITDAVSAAIDMGKAVADAIVVAESTVDAARLEATAANAAAAVAAEEAREAKSSASAARLRAEVAAAASAESAEKVVAAVASAEKLKQEKCEAQKVAAWQMLSHLPCVSDEARGLLSVLSASDPRNAMISELLEESCVRHRRELRAQDFCPAPDLVSTEISLVCNPGLAEQYRLARKQLLERQSTDACYQLPQIEHLLLPCADGCGKNQLNEVLLFHGALPDTVEKICRQGFDPRRGGEGAGAMFGIGTYFAANASKADIYTQRHSSELPKGAPRKLIVARVLLGEAYRATSHLKKAHRPPDRANGMPYDSVWADTRANGGAVDHLEFIIYDKVQAVPVLVITYHHATACRCAECGKRPAH